MVSRTTRGWQPAARRARRVGSRGRGGKRTACPGATSWPACCQAVAVRFASVNSLEGDRDRAVQLAEEGCILRGLVVSTVHGLANAGTDDRDEMGVCIEPPEYLLGLRRFEHCVAGTQREGQPSGPGDLDLRIYGLRKFCALAVKGSPTVSLLFFVRGADVLRRTELEARRRAAGARARFPVRAQDRRPLRPTTPCEQTRGRGRHPGHREDRRVSPAPTSRPGG
jgi:hypothetical protein